ncbi:MAG TPA: hypothetical protein VMF29_08300 [Candidatus Edwardsbacteria bacterium]|nr:hypothetical protein [Candidatus Edwardsbacteria bacterium]
MIRIIICTCLALALAGCHQRQAAGGGAAPEVALARLARDPAALQDRRVAVSGLLRNTGANYFTDLRLALTDSTGAAVAVRPWLPAEVPPPRPGAAPRTPPAVQSQFLDQRVRLTGCLRKDGADYQFDVQQAEILKEGGR